MGDVYRICLLLLRRRSLSLMRLSDCWVVVSTTSILVLKTETCHLSLHIFNHFSALDVSCHHEITALLFNVCDSILKRNIKL